MSIENIEQTDKFTAGRVFASLALFNQLTVPLFIFPITIPIIISAIVSTCRLEEFLQQTEVQKEFEGIRNMARVMSRSDASLDVFEIDENEGQTIDAESNEDHHHIDNNGKHLTNHEAFLLSRKSIPTLYTNKNNFNTTMHSDFQQNNEYFLQDIYENGNQQQATSMRNDCNNRRSFNASIKLKKNNQISASIKVDRNRPRQKSISTEIQMEIPNELVISIRNAIFSWRRNSNENETPLRIDRLDIPRGVYDFIYFLVWKYSFSLFIDWKYLQ